MTRMPIIVVLALCSSAWPSTVLARGGGGCLAGGSPVLTPSGPVPVENLKAGDAVLSLHNAAFVEARVQALTAVDPDEFYELTVDGRALRLTGEHPVETGPGVFRMASVLRAGDAVYVRDRQTVRAAAVQSARRLPATTRAFNLLVSPGGTYLANGIVVHNKGCFLPDTLIRKADGSEAPISSIRPGDRLLTFTSGGQVVKARVMQVLTREADEYRVVKTAAITVHVTAEHPFYVGQGTFKTLEALKAGDEIFVFDGRGLSSQRIESIVTVHAKTPVYNLQTDAPHTFFANGIAVHNKGGGGCFPAGTDIGTPNGRVPIENIIPGDWVAAVADDGQPVAVEVTETYRTRAPLLVVKTASGSLTTTAEHPLCLAAGGVCPAGKLEPGDEILIWRDEHVTPSAVVSLDFTDDMAEVYNLTVGDPHTFIAGDFVVHNKGGGGGFHGGHSSRRGSGSSGGGGNAVMMVWLAFVVFVVVAALIKKQKVGGGNLDFVYSPSQVARKSGKTLKLLEFIAKQDPAFAPDILRKQAETTFLTLQQCWQARDYAPMKPLLMPDLYQNHVAQLQGMVRNHEINVIDDVCIDRIDLVNVRYTFQAGHREFTALITATACDYYIDDRTRTKLRGDDEPAQFQEFWTFQHGDPGWLLREIEQTGESDVLKDENFFEQFTDTGVAQIVGPEAAREGQAGPWLERAVGRKEDRIERLLNFLVQTDAIWNRQAMLETTRRVFLEIMATRESGQSSDVPDNDLFPDVAAHLREQIDGNRARGLQMEFRNLCVRKVELILIRNFTDNRRDEFVARVRAHAQKILRQHGTVRGQDDDVTLFEQYVTLGRLDNRWKLKEIISADQGSAAVRMENLDQDSSPEQVQWYYQNKRAN